MAERVTWRLPPDTPWWRVFRRSWEKRILQTVQETLGDGPFEVAKTEGEFVWIETDGRQLDFHRRWLQTV